MTRREALRTARAMLAASNVEDAPLESEVILRHVLGINRVRLYLDLDTELSSRQQKKFSNLIQRRLAGEPTAYITGHREFYGLDFHVDHRVLIPRPESELLVEKALHFARTHQLFTLADIGTGCGAIAISLALNVPEVKIYATDLSADALRVARYNCRKHKVLKRVHLLEGDLLEPMPEPVDLIVANLPYVRESELGQTGLREPELALDGGKDGLEKIGRLAQQLKGKLRPRGGLLLEIGQGQAQTVTALLRNLLPTAEIEVAPDLAGTERVVSMVMQS